MNLAIDQGGDSGCAGALGHGFFALQQEQDCVGNFFFVHGDDFVHVFLYQRQSAVAGPANGDAVGDGRGRRQGHGFTCGDRSLHRRQPRGLHSDDLNFRIGFLDGAGDAADQAAASDRDHHRLDFGMLLQHFQSQRALAGDDRIVIERVDESEVCCWPRRMASSQASS